MILYFPYKNLNVKPLKPIEKKDLWQNRDSVSTLYGRIRKKRFGQNLASERLPIFPQSYWARLRNPALSRRDYKTKPNRFWILKTLQNLTRARCRCPNRDTEGWYSDLARSICTFLIFYFDKNPLKVRIFLVRRMISDPILSENSLTN